MTPTSIGLLLREDNPGDARLVQEALAEIERGRGSAYDPPVADACLKLFRKKFTRFPLSAAAGQAGPWTDTLS